jgi:hypothetical protein
MLSRINVDRSVPVPLPTLSRPCADSRLLGFDGFACADAVASARLPHGALSLSRC